MTTRSQKRKAAEELVSTEVETPLPEISQNENPVAGTSKSPRVISENLEDNKTTLRKEIMSDLTKILAENQKEMLKLIAPPIKKQTFITAVGETDSEPENIPENATSTPIKNKTTVTTRNITPVNSRNTSYYVFCSKPSYSSFFTTRQNTAGNCRLDRCQQEFCYSNHCQFQKRMEDAR